jgi:hypothetical protein
LIASAIAIVSLGSISSICIGVGAGIGAGAGAGTGAIDAGDVPESTTVVALEVNRIVFSSYVSKLGSTVWSYL